VTLKIKVRERFQVVVLAAVRKTRCIISKRYCAESECDQSDAYGLYIPCCWGMIEFHCQSGYISIFGFEQFFTTCLDLKCCHSKLSSSSSDFLWDLMNESKIFYDKTISEYYVQRRFCSHLQMSNQAVGAPTESVWIDLKFLTSGISLNFNLVIWDYINLFEVLWIPMLFKCLLSYWMERFLISLLMKDTFM
jgi:hypothetical protein